MQVELFIGFFRQGPEGEIGSEEGLQRAQNLIAIRIGQAADTNRIPFKICFYSSSFKDIDRGLKIGEPSCRGGIGVHGDVPLDVTGAECGLKQVEDGRFGRFILDRPKDAQNAVIIVEGKFRLHRSCRFYHCRLGHHFFFRPTPEQVPKGSKKKQSDQRRNNPFAITASLFRHCLSDCSRRGLRGVTAENAETSAGIPDGTTPPGVSSPINFGTI